MTYDFSLKACMESVEFEIKYLGRNPFECLGRAIIRAEQDICYNKTMIEAYRQYIADHNLSWNEDLGYNPHDSSGCRVTEA